MAGHSHANNIKHKKGRNDKLKSELFLKLRKKIEAAYNNVSDREKVFSIAREYNFPKEKVNSIIEKFENSRHQDGTFREFLYRGKYEILVYLRGNLLGHQEGVLKESVKIFSLEKLHSKRSQDYFYPVYLLRVDVRENLEEVILSSLSALVIDKIIKIEKKKETGNEFEIFFSERESLTKTAEFFASYPSGVYKLESRETFSPFSFVCIDSNDFLAYSSLLRTSFSKLGNNLQVFTNISDEKKWDHSSVG